MSPIGKLLPKDGFLITMKGTPTIDYSKSLTHLYQPLIGIQAVSLFQTLLNDFLSNHSKLQTHHALMNYLQMSLPDIYKLRLKLEGIGLLRTYKRIEIDKTIYTYDLQIPFSPAEFFNETMLSELLLHHVGKTRFTELKERFANKREITGEEVTVSFSSVFQTINLNIEEKVDLEVSQTHQLVDSLDFSWLELILKQRMLPVRKILTGKNKQILSELTHLYNLATHEIEKAILWAITDEHTIDIEQLKQACQDLYASKTQATPIRLHVKEKEEKEIIDRSKMSREELLIHRFETMSPRQLLEDLSDGSRASERDLKIISDVMMNQHIPKPVMNVLVHYALMQSNMKLSKPYLETIASHWSRANLRTAKEAMDFAKREINEFKNRKNRRKGRTSNKEVIPDWFKEREQVEATSKVDQSSAESRADQEEIMQRLKRHASKNNNHVQG